MANYHIVCTDQVPVSEPNNHAHIVAVGIDNNNDGYADLRHEKSRVISGMRSGDSYYTIGDVSGEEVYVEVARCQHCSAEVIKTYPDDARDNNLDSLRRCNWEKK